MKNIKYIFIAIIATSSIAHALPNFEIYNKAKQPIGIQAVTNDDVYRSVIKAGYALRTDLNTREKMTIIIVPNVSLADEAKYKNIAEKLTYKDMLGGETFIISARGNTVYLSWNPEKQPSLYPQTGPLMGLMGKTQSGLPLNNNVKASEIQRE